MSRRALLAGGAVALLAGCGEEETAAPRPADALLGPLAAERALGASEAPGATARRVAARARERARRLAAAVAAEGGRPHDAPAAAAATSRAELADRARTALAAHVAALPDLPGRGRRALAADLIVGAAEDLEALGAAEGAFPGTPA